jgi:hypothetical protein
LRCHCVLLESIAQVPTASATETIYARVPEPLKAGAKDYAEANGMTLTGAIADLLDRGLEAVENDDSIQRLQAQLQAKDSQLRDTETRLQGLQALSTTPLGVCAECKTVITAVDVLVHGKCSKGHPLRAPAQSGEPQGAGLDNNQALILLGALGLLLGALALSNK